MTSPGAVAILVPVEEEFAPYRELIPGLRRVGHTGPWEIHEGSLGERRAVVVISDCGPANAGAATERAISGARCEDMESAYVAQVCALHGVPFLAVRAISNNEAVCGLDEADVPRAIGAAGRRVVKVIASVARGL